ncbi:hypothetical protein AHAS_Ahas17G0067200 [Arachis hypogaea]
MNKTYNHLKWDFLKNILLIFGFQKEWVQLVMTCVRSANYRFKMNGNLTQKMYPQRGLRQCYPLSPYLFILAAEFFSILLEEAHRNGRIPEFKIRLETPTPIHPFFTEDCIILAVAKEEKIYQIMLIMNEYTETSGQKINIKKTGITYGRQVPIQVRVNKEKNLGMSVWDNPEKYLGFSAQ